MPTFPRGHHAFLVRLHNAKIVAQARTEDEPIRHAKSSTFEFPNPADLRGIPAIGFGVPGHVRGTQPENAATR